MIIGDQRFIPASQTFKPIKILPCSSRIVTVKYGEHLVKRKRTRYLQINQEQDEVSRVYNVLSGNAAAATLPTTDTISTVNTAPFNGSQAALGDCASHAASCMDHRGECSAEPQTPPSFVATSSCADAIDFGGTCTAVASECDTDCRLNAVHDAPLDPVVIAEPARRGGPSAPIAELESPIVLEQVEQRQEGGMSGVDEAECEAEEDVELGYDSAELLVASVATMLDRKQVQRR